MKFKGESHDIKLINFSVKLEEVLPFVPKSLNILQDNGRAIISMVDVKLKNMFPSIAPFFKFGYRYVAFRLLLDDTIITGVNKPKGVYFLKRFSNKFIFNFFGNILFNQKTTHANIIDNYDAFSLRHGAKRLEYALDPYSKCFGEPFLHQKIQRIDRVYETNENGIFVSKIFKENYWPIEPVKCYYFETDFFKTARFLGAFKVKEILNYTWNPPVLVSKKQLK